MKKILMRSLSVLFVPLMLTTTSCNKGLDELNVNNNAATSLDAVLLMNNAIFNTSHSYKTLTYDLGIVQQLITPVGGVVAGANFNVDLRELGGLSDVWETSYRNVIRNVQLSIDATKNVPSRNNMYQMSRIFKAYAYMVITDEYGDIPYKEAGAGFSTQVFFPKYDPQQEIYADIIKELTEAGAALNATTSRIETSDLLFAGDIVKWKKFAASVLLRAGMRLSKIDPTRAQTIVQAAFAAGVMTSNADNAYIRHDANFLQPVGFSLNGSESGNFYLAKPFVDQLKSTNDPRLSAIAIRYVGAANSAGQTPASGNTTASMQNGLPVGKDVTTAATQATTDGLASFYEYSQADRRRIVKINSPVFLVTAAQTQLLLAEARQRGWITTGTAASYFSEGIRLHMDQMATYDPGCAVAPAARDAFVAANTLTTGTELEKINTQYWIASFLNGPEAFANFRRTGFPNLTPNPYGQPGNPDVPNGTFIRRIGYPISELSTNATNVAAAVARMGPDKLSTRVWWDKQ
jgi:hypothetical protein